MGPAGTRCARLLRLLQSGGDGDLPDGRFVTGEKGIPRVKIYSPEGKFECVVVGPDVLSPNFSATTETRDDLRLHPVDLAVDGKSRIIVLDPNAAKVRVFERKEE